MAGFLAASQHMNQTPPQPARARIVTELRALIVLVLPIIAAQMAHTLLGFVDTAMAGRVSAEALTLHILEAGATPRSDA